MTGLASLASIFVGRGVVVHVAICGVVGAGTGLEACVGVAVTWRW